MYKQIKVLINRALEHHQKGEITQAEALYNQIIKLNPKHADALHLLGVIAHQRGDYIAAIGFIKQALSQQEDAGYFNNLGEVYRALNDNERAIKYYSNSVKCDNGFYMAWNNMGISLGALGKHKEAIKSFKHAISIRPNYNEAYNNLGNISVALGNNNEAIECFRKALKLNPKVTETHINLGNALNIQGNYVDAIAHLQHAITLNNNLPKAYNNLGIAFNMQGKLEAASLNFKHALILWSEYAEAHNNLGTTLYTQGMFDDSFSHYKRACKIKPNYAEAHSNLLLASHYHPKLSSEAILKKHIAWGESNVVQNKINESYKNDKNPERRLKVGYISPDFRTHSVAYFIEPILAHHDETFEIYCYSAVNRPDETTKRIERLVTHWVSIIGKSDEEVATRIRDDRIDILVDLAGHTAKNRLLLFAHKPAPIQVTYLGYPNTTGLPTMDYRLTDDYADPSGKTEKLHTEKLIRLSSTAWCYRPPKKIPEVKEYPAKAKGIVTFGSFNASYKLNDKVYELWAKILSRVKDSRLLLKSTNFADEGLKAQITENFLKQGIEQDRIILQGKVASHKAHMGYYHKIDIALDSFPYHGTTTTCEALYMGVPVVSLEGEDHRSRVGVSLLNQVKLQRLIAKTEEEYIEIACSLASDLEALGKLRKGLRPCMEKSPLMDETKFTHGLEKTYREMWQKWCSGS